MQHTLCQALGSEVALHAYSATLVGQRVIIIGGLGVRVWSCKEVSSTRVHASEGAVRVQGAEAMAMIPDACLSGAACHRMQSAPDPATEVSDRDRRMFGSLHCPLHRDGQGVGVEPVSPGGLDSPCMWQQ